jgi:hypothetical protein
MDTPITPTHPAAQTPAAPTVTPFVEPTPQADLTPAEASQMAEWAKQDLAKGKITAGQAEKIFTDLNTPLEQRGPDTRTDQRKLLDKQFPPAKESEYLIRYYTPGQEPNEMPKEVKQFDANARAGG